VRVHDRRGRRVIGQGSLGLHSADLKTLAQKLGSRICIHHGNEDNDSGNDGTEANEAVLR
jgi:hypothetical protein